MKIVLIITAFFFASCATTQNTKDITHSGNYLQEDDRPLPFAIARSDR